MNRSSTRSTLLLIALASLLGAGACAKSSTNPYGTGGGGGGGSGGSLFNFGPFAAAQSAQFTFASAGTFGYHCNTHAAMGMVGSVQVDAAGADSQVVQIGPSGTLTFSPATAHIKPGAYVRWVNASALTNHTVTSN
jgi:plastocyanin